MYVCVCNAVTESDIHEAAAQGARRVRDLRVHLGVTADCARCAGAAKCCLDRAVASASSSSHRLMSTPTRLLEALA